MKNITSLSELDSGLSTRGTGVKTMKGLYPKIMLLIGGAFAAIVVAITAFVYISGSRQIEQQGLARAETLNQIAFEALYASMRQGGGREGNRQVIARLRELGAIACHRSQVERMPQLAEDVRRCNADYGRRGGSPYAEAFKVLHPFCDT